MSHLWHIMAFMCVHSDCTYIAKIVYNFSNTSPLVFVKKTELDSVKLYLKWKLKSWPCSFCTLPMNWYLSTNFNFDVRVIEFYLFHLFYVHTRTQFTLSISHSHLNSFYLHFIFAGTIFPLWTRLWIFCCCYCWISWNKTFMHFIAAFVSIYINNNNKYAQKLGEKFSTYAAFLHVRAAARHFFCAIFLIFCFCNS